MKPTIKRELVFIIFSLLFVLALFLRTSTAVIVEDLVAEFAVPAAALGLMASAFFYAYSFFQLPVGMLSDRIGVRYTVVISGLLGVAGTILFALSMSIQMATWARLLTGVGTAGIWVPALKYLSLVYPPDKFATRTAIISTIGSVGLLFATFPLAVLVEGIGWRYSFVMVAAVLLVLIIIAWFLMSMRSTPQSVHETVINEKHKKEAKPLVTQISFLRNRSFWIFALWAFLVYGVQFSFQGLWGAVYLQDTFGISRETAGSHLFFTSLGILLGGIFWGLMSDRYFQARRPVLFIATMGMLVSWAIMVIISAYPGPLLTSFLYFFLGFFSIVFLVCFSCVKELFPIEKAGTAIGAVNSIMLFGAGAYQGITGYMIDYFLAGGAVFTAYRVVFILYLGSISAALLLVLLMPETFPSRVKKNQLQDKLN